MLWAPGTSVSPCTYRVQVRTCTRARTIHSACLPALDKRRALRSAPPSATCRNCCAALATCKRPTRAPCACACAAGRASSAACATACCTPTRPSTTQARRRATSPQTSRCAPQAHGPSAWRGQAPAAHARCAVVCALASCGRASTRGASPGACLNAGSGAAGRLQQVDGDRGHGQLPPEGHREPTAPGVPVRGREALASALMLHALMLLAAP